ncbi:MAG: polysaccharide pyruvyl transferase family protein [Rikenellaceae bacterium]
MKIGIITITPQNNYGGAMQAYALQRVLQSMGHDAYVLIKRKQFFKPKPSSTLFVALKNLFIKYILGKNLISIFIGKRLRLEYNFTHQHYIQFLDENIKQFSYDDYSDIPADEFDALVVGSDQVWRATYFKGKISAMYFDFAKGWNVKRYAYAASFGKDDVSEYSPKQLQQCADLAKLFDAISVREDSGVDLCREHLGVNAEHLLDPTILLSKEDYTALITNEPQQTGILNAYILDHNSDATQLIDRCCRELNLKQQYKIIKRYRPSLIYSNLDEYVIPSPYKWLAEFRDAEFVVTDSFHGAVFSIIFNKPFVVMVNHKRGAARIHSLLKIFGLEDRLIERADDLNTAHFAPIDYERVNRIKAEWQQRSFDFLKQL